MKRKLLPFFGTILISTTPIAAVVSCLGNSEKKKEKSISEINQIKNKLPLKGSKLKHIFSLANINNFNENEIKEISVNLQNFIKNGFKGISANSILGVDLRIPKILWENQDFIQTLLERGMNESIKNSSILKIKIIIEEILKSLNISLEDWMIEMILKGAPGNNEKIKMKYFQDKLYNLMTKDIGPVTKVIFNFKYNPYELLGKIYKRTPFFKKGLLNMSALDIAKTILAFSTKENNGLIDAIFFEKPNWKTLVKDKFGEKNFFKIEKIQEIGKKLNEIEEMKKSGLDKDVVESQAIMNIANLIWKLLHKGLENIEESEINSMIKFVKIINDVLSTDSKNKINDLTEKNLTSMPSYPTIIERIINIIKNKKNIILDFLKNGISYPYSKKDVENITEIITEIISSSKIKKDIKDKIKPYVKIFFEHIFKK